ncbi:unnamed protein product [Caenorhabditis angaria]|uniref:Uncharacterized protein n=1 Tax=Caenorhabditis angaria TaxID=860376 RepID=A0A9P1IVJ2_9PELO|nr:unnamed protein product [Caenorhabditis angaria]
MCEYHDVFLANDSIYFILSHIFSTIGLPIQIFGFYCIIKITPKEMTSIKFSMLLLHISCFLSDSIFGDLAIPVIFLPYFCGYSIGILNYFGVPTWIQLYIGVTASTMINNLIMFLIGIHGMLATIVMIFIHIPYRKFLFALFTLQKKSDHKKNISIAPTVVY